MLNSIRIDGYKSIKHLDLALKPINILVGGNGAGKSNFVSFFKLVNAIYEQRLQNFTMRSGVDKLLFYGIKRTKEIKGALRFASNYSPSYSFNLHPSDDGSMFLAEEVSPTGRKTNVKESAIRDSKKSDTKDHLENCKIYHFHDTGVGAPLRSEANINDAFSLRTDGGNLPAILYLLKEKYPKTLKRIELVVRETVPCFERFLLEPSPYDKSKIDLSWREINDPEKYFDVNDFSDGSLRFIALATLLMHPVLPKIIIIDEPELGLHPVAIYKLAGLIRSASARGCQIIAATQSVELVGNFDPKEIITVDRKDGQSVFNKLDESKLKTWLDDYSLGELWTKGIIDGQP